MISGSELPPMNSVSEGKNVHKDPTAISPPRRPIASFRESLVKQLYALHTFQDHWIRRLALLCDFLSGPDWTEDRWGKHTPAIIRFIQDISYKPYQAKAPDKVMATKHASHTNVSVPRKQTTRNRTLRISLSPQRIGVDYADEQSGNWHVLNQKVVPLKFTEKSPPAKSSQRKIGVTKGRAPVFRLNRLTGFSSTTWRIEQVSPRNDSAIANVRLISHRVRQQKPIELSGDVFRLYSTPKAC